MFYKKYLVLFITFFGLFYTFHSNAKGKNTIKIIQTPVPTITPTPFPSSTQSPVPTPYENEYRNML